MMKHLNCLIYYYLRQIGSPDHGLDYDRHRSPCNKRNNITNEIIYIITYLTNQKHSQYWKLKNKITNFKMSATIIKATKLFEIIKLKE